MTDDTTESNASEADLSVCPIPTPSQQDNGARGHKRMEADLQTRSELRLCAWLTLMIYL